jgi:hypothetical protein
MVCALGIFDLINSMPMARALSPPLTSLREESDRKTRDYCPWDAWRAYVLLFDPPAPTGEENPLWLPNIANPGAELSLAIAGEEEKYIMRVGSGGFGGRLVHCMMPEPRRDDDAMMAKLGPLCSLSEPPVMKCPIFDAWFEGAPGGPLHDLVHAGATEGPTAEPGAAPVGASALAAVVDLLDAFSEADRLVGLAQWELDVLRAEAKSAEASAKELVDNAKRTKAFWGDDWGPSPRVLASGHPVGLGGGRLGVCFEARDAWLNASEAAAAELKRELKALDDKAAAKLERLKQRRKKLTSFDDGQS